MIYARNRPQETEADEVARDAEVGQVTIRPLFQLLNDHKYNAETCWMCQDTDSYCDQSWSASAQVLYSAAYRQARGYKAC